MTTSDTPKIEMVDAKAAAKIFKTYTKNWVHGPFGPPTPPTVQKAIDAGNMYATLIGDNPQVLAICNKMKSGSTHDDFGQNEIKIKSGELFVTDVAKVPAALDMDIADLLNDIQSRMQAPMWIEVYEEDSVLRRIMAAEDFGYRGTKVNAYGDLTGMYYRDWPHATAEDTDVPMHETATLNMLDGHFITAEERAQILLELHYFADWWSAFSGERVWADHYSTYNKNNTWSAFSLRNYEHDDPTSIVKPKEMPRKWKDENPEKLDYQIGNSIAYAHFPTVATVASRLVQRGYGVDFERIRLMRLTAKGGELQRHSDITDRYAGTRDGFVSRLHIPLVTDPQVEFSMWGHRGEKYQRFMGECELWYLDMRKPHAAVNRSLSVERVHLVIDVVANDTLRSKLAEVAESEGTEYMTENPWW